MLLENTCSKSGHGNTLVAQHSSLVNKCVLLLVLAWNTSTDKGGLFSTCTLLGMHTSKGHAAMSPTAYVRQSLTKWRYWNDPTDVKSKVIFELKNTHGINNDVIL